jgi:splicing suppressor protein 51
MKIGSLKMCGGCKLVGYFSKEDQKADWAEHKTVCKAVTGLMKSLNVKHICEQLSGDRMAEALGRALGRDLRQGELDLCNYPRVCGLCGKGGAVQDSLRNCTRCHCIAWCPDCIEKGKEGHEEWCHLLKTAMEDYKHEKSLGHQVQKYVPPISTEFKPVPASIENLFEKEVGKLVSNKLPGYQESELRYLTFLYSCPLTVLYGVEQAGLAGGPVEEAESLTIHLVGARTAEMRHLVGWEIIALRLPKLKQLHVIFIGDEVTSCLSPLFILPLRL